MIRELMLKKITFRRLKLVQGYRKKRHFHASNLKSVMKLSEINSTKQNKPVRGITFQCIKRENAITNRFEVGLDLFKKYIICLQN